VAVLDLEHFKEVNDRDGHQAGDQILREVGAVLRSRIRPGDTAARTGGDEFVILLPSTPVDHATVVVTRIIDSLPMACSFGLADWPAGTTFEEATRNADRAMYAHKNRDTQ
jgi:diguanylate cyclase (GGDEF)-like protein